MKDSIECYKILGLEPGASAKRVRKAYLQLSHFYDPDRDIGMDPEQAAQAKLKRLDVEEAYHQLCCFLPDLQGGGHRNQDPGLQDRDFNESVQEPPSEVSNTLVAIVLGTVVALILGWGYHLYRQTQDLPPAPTLIVDQEAAPHVG
jgi:hypothetical protein